MAADFSPTGLRVLREVAQTGSFSAAAVALGYTQSAVSRQVAALEAVAERRLFDRGRQGVTLTPAGARLLRSATRVLDELDAARRELTGELAIGVAANHPLARARSVEVEELEGQVWVASRSDAGETLLGVWPGLAERPDVRYAVRDWLAKLRIVAAGLAITTIAPIMGDALPEGVKLVAVRGEPQETRRVVVARLPGPRDAGTARVIDALVAAARGEFGVRRLG